MFIQHSKLYAALSLLALVSTTTVAATAQEETAWTPDSISALAFHPDGTLLIGDSRAGAIHAVDVAGGEAPGERTWSTIDNFETRVAARLGTSADQVLIHDLAVHPLSKVIYLAVSRGRGNWSMKWHLPNDLADARVLMTVDQEGEIGMVEFEGLEVATTALPNPVEDRPHRWKEGASVRSDAITDLAYHDGFVYVAGLSNEEFASTMWKVPYPFSGAAQATTLEVFHGAHGKYETHSPVRTFVPYEFDDSTQLLAAYLCTPFATFPLDALEDGAHVRGRTLGEFGSGNYPLDMVVYRKLGSERILIANSNLPLMIVDPAEIAAFNGSIIEPVEEYTAGLDYEIRSGSGVQQLDVLDDETVVTLVRTNAGTLDLVALATSRL